MNYKNLIQVLGFLPKENTSGIFYKKYNTYAIEIDFEKEVINFGNKIKGESKTTQNFSQAENWVVLECVDRLLEKGYQPQNITLEKTWKLGHLDKGRLDILVSRSDGSAYLMIECKTWGSEFDKELKKLENNGGQLFSYFQQDKNAEVIMLYTSKLEGKNIEYKNSIIKIEEDYRQTGNVKDFYERWNKLPKANGIFDSWVVPYDFVSKALTKRVLKELKQEDSSFIFNRFLEILRHNVVSDKPNAFNKIFTLFLCKIVDEYSKNEDDELEFQWLEGQDNHISFQKRLTDLYNKGMRELLEKNVTDVSDSEFNRRFEQVDDKFKEEFRHILTEIRLKKNNEFAIKEVYDDASFDENAKVVKEVVELLQEFRIRYNYRQQFLSDFFELLLTTGLKQESGQFFTPVPVARFIIKSLPLQEICAQKIELGNKNDLLPTIIDYAAGSGHFLTESMEVVQQYLDKLKPEDFKPETRKQIQSFQTVQFDWAEKYVYGIEKDYRLVKTAKVSCYLHGDGLAKVIHGDGLGDFATSKEFKDLLKETDKTYPQDNKQFDVIISNPPYSVSAFKGLMDEEKSKLGFDLYSRLTDQSSEIECLFIERTKQLLKDGGVAGIILPSSILSNTGIYTQTREILFRHFEILGIAELGSNTFMATGTNTVTLFLRRRNNADAYNVEEAIKKCFVSLQDVTINGIEKPIKKYVAHVWDSISFEDYKTLLQKTPNKNIEQHEIYKEYTKKIKAKNEAELWTNILALEQDKLLYFILAYPQKLVLVKTGEKNEEKRFLGYEFSNRRGSEGIHAIQRSKSIDECTHLYDADSFTNPEKASFYIYKAFLGEYDLDLPESLQQNLSYHNLVDMFTFDRVDFEKNISLSAKKKVKIESKWDNLNIGDLILEQPKSKIKVGTAKDSKNGEYLFFTSGESVLKFNEYLVENENIYLSTGGNAVVKYYNGKASYSTDTFVIRSNNDDILKTKYLFYLLESIIIIIDSHYFAGVGLKHLQKTDFRNIKIPLPPLDIQQKIVSEIEALEKQEQKAVEGVEKLRQSIGNTINNSKATLTKLEDITTKIGSGATPKGGEGSYQSSGITLIRSQNIYDYGMIEKGLAFISEEQARKLDNVTVEKNDILFNITGASIARCCIVEDKYLPARVNQHVSIIRTNEKALPKYVHAILVSPEFKEKLLEIGNGATSRQAITKSQLEEFKIPLLSIEEQKKIVSEIENTEAKITELEKKRTEIPKQKEKILQKYLV
jgi:type I restriction enzyme M protein